MIFLERLKDFDDNITDAFAVAMMNISGIEADDYTKHPEFSDYQEKASLYAKNISGEDYLSLSIALDKEDIGTVGELASKAKDNVEQEKEMGNDVEEDFSYNMEEAYSRLNTADTLHENKNHKPDCGCPFCKKDDADADDEEEDVSEDETDTEEKVEESIKDNTMKKERPTVNEAILGMASVGGLDRMRQLAGMGLEEDIDLDKPEGAGQMSMGSDMDTPVVSSADDMAAAMTAVGAGEMDEPALIDEPVEAPDPVIDEPVADLPAVVEPEVEIEPTIEPAPAAPVTVDANMSDEYTQAKDALDKLSRLVMDMKISEFKLFVADAEEFQKKVKEVGRQFLETSDVSVEDDVTASIDAEAGI